MKKYMTIEVDNSIEKDTIDEIWDIIEHNEFEKYSKLELKIENSYIKRIEMTNEYNVEVINIDEIEVNKNIKRLFIENKYDFWLLTL